MARKKKEDKKEEEITTVIVSKKTSGEYKVFKELSDEELKDLLFYEEFIAQVSDRYIKSFTIDDIKKKYDGCTFPPFVLNTMRIIRKTEKLVYFD